VVAIGKTLTRESSIIVTFSIIILLYSFFMGQLLWGIIVIFLAVILLRLIPAGANNPMNNPLLWIASIIIISYSYIMGQLLWGIIVIFLVVILLRLIPVGANNPTNNPLLWIISIIIISYSYIIGQLLWGLIAVLQIAILWVLIYRISKKVKEPTGITVLAVFYAFTIFCEIVGLVTGQPAIVFGVTLSGVSAQLVYVISILIGIYLTYGFIKLFKLAWIMAIILGFYQLINISINIISYSSHLSFGIIEAMLKLLLNIIILSYIFGKAEYFRK
jgi:hypothetical protein